MQVGGLHAAVIVAVPGKVGVTTPELAGKLNGRVELNSRERPVMGLPLVSRTEAVKS